MKLITYLLISIIIFSCNVENRNVQINQNVVVDSAATKVVKFDTLPNGQKLLDNTDSANAIYHKEIVGSDTLKGGFITCYAIDDSMRYFYLRKQKELHLLSKLPIHQSAWALGRLHKDYENFFITEIDNGNDVPSTFQIFAKKTANNLLGKNVEAHSFKSLNDTLFMIYDILNENNAPDSIVLFNVSTLKSKSYTVPNDLPKFLNIELVNINKKVFTIKYYNYINSYEEKTETYVR